jgi:hypothetical protein
MLAPGPRRFGNPNMSDLLGENLLSISQAAKRVPAFRGRAARPSTIFRWLTIGVKMPDGSTLKLEGIRLAARWLTTAEALTRFLATQNAAYNPDSTPVTPPTATQRERAAKRAGELLESIGM